ncbi:YaaR family protein [Saccharibacillus sp. CPCC 101409]|uniref:YaaR family protein n=1 Tax=Saccharibacillus sp. CPCC 101409 TaxID=3058041 RepID=UPI0026736773|nr:YaaR family protein [Saccharibacillus sp. CPCC 101409]MDO3412924.1 YaaR family protein [Saccharibacillus sp. CPCC 101409]
MKINPGFRPLNNMPVAPETAARPVEQRSFADAIRNQEAQTTNDELGRRMQEINRQGDRLARSMTVRELRAYRTMVKRFLEDTVRRGVGMKDTKGWDRLGRTKRYKLIDEVDGSLLAMADELLTSEEGRLQLLQQIGEIRGLLVNLLF